MPQAPEQNQAGGGGRRSWLGHARGAIRGYPLLFILVALGVGAIVGVPATEAVDRYFSSDQFCAQTCHVMTATVAEEFQDSPHWKTTTGVRPACADCHVSEGLTMAMWDHFVGTRELIAFAFRGIRTPEAFEAERAEAANRVRMKMIGNVEVPQEAFMAVLRLNEE